MCNDAKAAVAELKDISVPDEGQNESVLCPNVVKCGCVNIHLWLAVGVSSCTYA